MKESKIRRLLCSSLSVLVCVLFAHTGHAARVQGFEAGDPAVVGAGDAGPQGTYQGEAAPDPTHWYLITTVRSTDTNEDSVVPQSGTNALAFATLNDSSHFNGAAPVGTDGSGVFIPFTVTAGDATLSLSYDFLSNEPGQAIQRNDFSFAAFFNTSGVQQGSTNTFATVSGSSFSLFGAQTPFAFHTGIQTLSLSVASLAPGNYVLGLGVADAGPGGDHASALLVDNISVAPVPEPSTIGLIIAGAVSCVAMRRRLKK
jgi:hypothetical protein